MKKLKGFYPQISEIDSLAEQIPDEQMQEFCLGLKHLIPDKRTAAINCYLRNPTDSVKQQLLEMGVSEEELNPSVA
jgi:hypothetical protein